MIVNFNHVTDEITVYKTNMNCIPINIDPNPAEVFRWCFNEDMEGAKTREKC